MLRAMKVLGIGLINAFALPTVIGKRAPFPTRGKTGGLHRAQPRPAPKRKGQEDQARRRQKGPRSDLRHLLIQGAQAVLRMGRATALGEGGQKAAAMSASPPSPASCWSNSGTCSRATRLDGILPPCVRTLQRRPCGLPIPPHDK